MAREAGLRLGLAHFAQDGAFGARGCTQLGLSIRRREGEGKMLRHARVFGSCSELGKATTSARGTQEMRKALTEARARPRRALTWAVTWKPRTPTTAPKGFGHGGLREAVGGGLDSAASFVMSRISTNRFTSKVTNKNRIGCGVSTISVGSRFHFAADWFNGHKGDLTCRKQDRPSSAQAKPRALGLFFTHSQWLQAPGSSCWQLLIRTQAFLVCSPLRVCLARLSCIHTAFPVFQPS